VDTRDAITPSAAPIRVRIIVAEACRGPIPRGPTSRDAGFRIDDPPSRGPIVAPVMSALRLAVCSSASRWRSPHQPPPRTHLQHVRRSRRDRRQRVRTSRRHARRGRRVRRRTIGPHGPRSSTAD
jgi:hypothetical protein